MKKTLSIMTLLLLTANIYCSLFDNVTWLLNSEKKGIKLYTDSENSFIKAETLFNFNDAAVIVNCLLDFEEYLKLYPKTLTFKPIKHFNDNNFLIYVVINFFPMKNRDYVIRLNSYKVQNRYVIEWHPPAPGEYDVRVPLNPDFLHVEKVYGRWIIEQLENDKVFISIELHNDWKMNLSSSVTFPFERDEALNTVSTLLNYVNKQKRK